LGNKAIEIMTTYRIFKHTSKYQKVTYKIIEKSPYLTGFADEETGYEFDNLAEAERKLTFLKFMYELSLKNN
jgi:hypothetical protein